jgi:hypothetical protein
VKKYDLHLRHGNIPGTIRFHINAPLPQMRLINSLIKAEYESRAPASAVLVNGGLVRCGYTSSLNRRCPVLIIPPLWSKLSEKIQQLENTKIMLFELSVIETHESTTKSIWMARSGLSTPPDGSFAVSLRFYDSLSTDRNEFMRVFGEFYFGYTQEFGASSSTWKDLQLAEVTLLSGERRLSESSARLVPRIGSWTPKDGFKFTGTPHGAGNEPSVRRS